jgi:hypothetical protein
MNYVDIQVEGVPAARAHKAAARALRSLRREEREQISLEVVERRSRGLPEAANALVVGLPTMLEAASALFSIVVTAVQLRRDREHRPLEMVVEFADGTLAVFPLPRDPDAAAVEIGGEAEVARIRSISIRARRATAKQSPQEQE